MILHPLMLAWLGGAAVPLLLHLLSRSQYKTVPWGAMMFLTGPDAGPQYSARFRQWTLLLLRMGLIGLLATALARPVVAARYSWVPSAGLTTGGREAVMIILDDSAGMGYQQNGQSRLDQARQVALQILSALKRGDEAALLLAGTHDYQAPPPPSADLQSIAARVEDLQPDIGVADFAPDLLRAAEILSHASPPNREIFLICDQQARGWRNLSEGFRRQWRARRQGGAIPRLTVIPVGDDSSDNIAVDRIDVPDHAAIHDELNTAEIQIRNYGPVEATAVPFSVWSGTRSLFESTVSVAAHGTRILTVPLRFTETGSRILSAAVKTTGLTYDDRLDYSVEVLEQPRILVVTRDASAASQPIQNLFASPPLFKNKPTCISIQQFSALACKDTDVVILQDVADFSGGQLQTLHQFVSAGGGLLILPGIMTTAQQYNQTLFGSAGLFRVSLGSRGVKPQSLGSVDTRSAVFRYLADALHAKPDDGPLHFFNLTSGEQILARYAGGTPAIVESDLDSGRMIFFNGIVDCADPRSTKLGFLLQSIVRHLATGSATDRNLSPGQPIVVRITDAVDENTASVQFLSRATREPLVVTRSGNHTELRFNRTDRAGIYRVRYRAAGKEKTLNYVAPAPRVDSDLTPLTASQWETIHGRISFNRVDLSTTTVAQTMDTQRGGREIWIELLGAVIALMAIEMLLSRWWTSA